MNNEMKLKAEQMGVTILDFKPTQFEWEGFFVVLATTHKKEFVTWTWANGGFHHGHYFGDMLSRANRVNALLDFEVRCH
jgi:hypothetical protein